jgi:poly(A) polymerase
MISSTHKLPSLADAPWLRDPRVQKIMAVIAAAGGEVRVVGGAVRNGLLGEPISDVDLATTLLPEDVMRVCKAAGLGVHPTGLEHGTITVVNKGQAFEVTTLRRDVETDGRRAVVAFTKDWREDAMRRDFTINAMFCDATGKIYDFTTGYQDILRKRVRFVGGAELRIQEDYLRILRFFRFHARYGKGSPCPVGLTACVKLRSGLKKISAERIRQELLKLVVAPRAVDTLKIMAAHGILKTILPHTDDWRVLGRLPQVGVLRLYVLAKKPADLKERLRLSNHEAERLDALNIAPKLNPAMSQQSQHALLYRMGGQSWSDAVAVAWAKSSSPRTSKSWQALIDLPQVWDIPKFPLNGKDAIAAGLVPGPGMGAMLRQLEDWWVAQDFGPTREELLKRIGHGN